MKILIVRKCRSFLSALSAKRPWLIWCGAVVATVATLCITGALNDYGSPLAEWTAVFLAILGWGAWKSQLHGAADFEMKRRLRAAIYRFRNAIKSVSCPIPIGGDPGLKTALERTCQMYFGDGGKWRLMQDARAGLDEVLADAEALWGRTSVDVVARVYTWQGDLFCAINDRIEEMQSSRQTPEERAKTDAILFSPGDDKADKFLQSIESDIRVIEKRIEGQCERT